MSNFSAVENFVENSGSCKVIERMFLKLQTPVFDRISKTPTPQRRDIPRVITNGRRIIVDPSLKRKDKM